MLRWDEPVSFVKGATPSVRKAWESLSIETVGDLLSTLPRRYDDYSKIIAIQEAHAGDTVTVQGHISKTTKLPTFRKRMVLIRTVIEDGTGKIAATFFNQPWLLQEFLPDREILFSGKIQQHPKYGKSLANPIWEPAGSETVAAGKLAPVYGLSGTLVQKTYRRLVQQAIETLETPADPLTESDLRRLKLLPLVEAIRAVHLPKNSADAELGRERFAFNELLIYRLALNLARSEADTAGAPHIPFDEAFAKRFAANLPFALTDGQKRAVWACIKEMEGGKPMRRLLQGDVGSGKTVVAAFLAAHVQFAGASAALLAPTDLLARQHAATFRRLYAGHHIPLLLVTRLEKRWMYGQEERDLSAAELEAEIDKGRAVIVGTHAILEPRRLPPDLALAVVDEQHRFGVDQRETLVVSSREDGLVPHLLSMTATPIPRSLALTLYGDLEVSILREKPEGRLPIATRICVGQARETAYRAIREAVARGERAYVVCPLIDPSDALGVKSATEEWKRLTTGPLKGLNVALIHGRLKPADKERAMQDFAEGKADVLVATSVIEVGIDVPQATVIAIEGAERFGLAQLHQLRGRVGRSTLPSKCFLLTDVEGESLGRLKLMEGIHDGFVLAEEDLKLRGSGSLFGTEQSGHHAFHAVRQTDVGLMLAARDEATRILEEDPTLERHAAWKEKVQALRKTSHLE